jgi:hypothetical protein
VQQDAIVGIKFGHVDGELEKDRLDWDALDESQACKAAYMGLLCSYAFPPCKVQEENDNVDEDAEWHQRASMRERLFAECKAASTIWTKPYPDNANNASTFDLIVDADTVCFPDGSGGGGQDCKRSIDEVCNDNNDCWSGVCDEDEGICLGRVEGDSCHNNEGCFGGECDGEYRCSAACVDDRACVIGGSCVEGECTSGAMHLAAASGITLISMLVSLF